VGWRELRGVDREVGAGVGGSEGGGEGEAGEGEAEGVHECVWKVLEGGSWERKGDVRERRLRWGVS